MSWYSIYTRKISNITVTRMMSLQGKYERVLGVNGRKGHCRVPRERNSIQCAPEMQSAFVQLKEALSAESDLYVLSANGEYRIDVDACDHAACAVLEHQDSEGEWKPCSFFSQKLEGKDWREQRPWSTCDQQTYTLVSCLLKLGSGIRGQNVTVYTNHRSLESWYKEDLCTLSRPLGRRGRWHKLLSGYHIEAIY